MNLQELTDQLLHKPLEFEKSNGVEQMIAEGVTFDDLRFFIRKIYDLNENQLIETSNANRGTLGKMNKKSTEDRKKLFNKKADSQKEGKTYYRIYAEGDSWFQFPTFIKDIVDWLNSENDFLIYSEAYGGDWITNILYEGQYISSLSNYSPEFFLISGGGNDLVGNHRLGIMVEKNSKCIRHENESTLNSAVLTPEQKNMVLEAQPFITKEFYAFLNVIRLQYTLLFNNIYSEKSKHKHIISITQGYDYPFPNPKRRICLKYPLQPILNSFLDSGDWLFTPLMIKGIMKPELQRAIMMAFIYEFNEMMISFAKSNKFPNVFHIDCRGVAPVQKHWFDELHLKSDYFKKVAGAYKHVIRNHNTLSDRVIRVSERK